MAKSTSKDTQALFHSLRSAYAATPTNLKVSLSSNFSFSLSIIEDLNTNRFFFFFVQIIDLYVVFSVFTALIQVFYDFII